MEDGVYNGRGGLGNIYTWAAGNGLQSDDDSNADGYTNSRFTIAVTAVDHNGEQSYYAEPGANILVSAPSNGAGVGITTTDIVGSPGTPMATRRITSGAPRARRLLFQGLYP